MKTSADWIDAIKRQYKLPSDYAAAKLMEIDPNVVCHYRAGRRAMDNFACIKTSELLREDLRRVIASVEAERARTEQRKDFWKRLAACVFLTVSGAAMMPDQAYANVAERDPFEP